MTEAKFFLVVRFWIEPAAEAQALAWLAEQGAYAMLYGIASRAAFEAYEANAALKAKFARERAPFERQLRIERFAGEVDMGAGT